MAVEKIQRELREIPQRQAIHLNRIPQIRVITPVPMLDLFTTAMKGFSNPAPGGYLIQMPSFSLSKDSDSIHIPVVVLQVALINNYTGQQVSMLYRDTDSHLKYISCNGTGDTTLGSYSEFLELYTRAPHKVFCLYTKDCIGGDFDKFSRELVQEQATFYQNFSTRNKAYQHLARARVTGEVGKPSYEEALTKAQRIPVTYYLINGDWLNAFPKDELDQLSIFRSQSDILQREQDKAKETYRLETKIERKKAELTLQQVRDVVFSYLENHPDISFSRVEKVDIELFMTQTLEGILEQNRAQAFDDIIGQLNVALANVLPQIYPADIRAINTDSSQNPYWRIHKGVQNIYRKYCKELVQGKSQSLETNKQMTVWLISEITQFLDLNPDQKLNDVLDSAAFRESILKKISAAPLKKDKELIINLLQDTAFFKEFTKHYVPFSEQLLRKKALFFSSSSDWTFAIKNRAEAKHRKNKTEYIEKWKALDSKRDIQIPISTQAQVRSSSEARLQEDIKFYTALLESMTLAGSSFGATEGSTTKPVAVASDKNLFSKYTPLHAQTGPESPKAKA